MFSVRLDKHQEMVETTTLESLGAVVELECPTGN